MTYSPLVLFSVAILLFSACKKEQATEVAVVIPEKDLIAEGIAYDPITKSFFVGSIFQRKVIQIDSNGQIRDFIASAQDDILDVLGIKVDPQRRQLWVCSAASKRHGIRDGESILFKYDLENGTLLKKYAISNANGRHLFNDLAINSLGDAYVTDSEAKMFWKIDVKADTLEPWLASSNYEYPNGIALSSDERYLLMADWNALHRITLETKEDILILSDAATDTLGRIDGMEWYQDGIVAVQNGVDPNRIVRIKLNNDFSKVENYKILEMAHPLFNIPTTGAIAENSFYVIANSMLDLIGENGEIVDSSQLKETFILKIPIK